jgi:hypothetical protein
MREITTSVIFYSRRRQLIRDVRACEAQVTKSRTRTQTTTMHAGFVQRIYIPGSQMVFSPDVYPRGLT